MGRPKGSPKTGGRKPGSANKVTASIKAAFKEAFDELGGVAALVEWARTNQDDFYKLASKLIPVDIGNADDKPFKTENVSAKDQEILDRFLKGNK